MIQLHPDQGEERDGDAAPRPPINVVYAGSGPATFLSTGLSFELEPDILMPLTTHPQGLWVVPAAEFPVSLPGQQAPTELLKPASADLLDVPEREVWPSEALDERLLRYNGEAAELVLLTTPEYENGWRALLGGAVAIAVLRGLTMPDGAIADARIEVPAEAADKLADLPAVLAKLAGRDSMEEDAQQVDLLDTAQPLLQQDTGDVQETRSAPQEPSAGAGGAAGQPSAANAPTRPAEAAQSAPQPIADMPTNKLRAALAAKRAESATSLNAARTPPAAPRLSDAKPPVLKPRPAPAKAAENPHPWERSEASALNAVPHHARCEGHQVQRKSDGEGVRYRAATNCRILAEAPPDAADSEDGVLLG